MDDKERIEELNEEKEITKEDAITELQNTIDLIKQDGKDWVDERDIPIFEMAIEALKNQKSVIAELEKIKTKLDEEDDLIDCCICEYDHGYHNGLEKGIEYIDSYVKELKGDNNE